MNDQPAIIFDLGKVLVDFDYMIAINRLAQRFGGTPAAVAKILAASPLLIAYEGGEVSTAEFFRQVREATGFPGDLAEFSELFGNIFTEIPLLVQTQRELRAAGFPCFIFSNTNELAVRWITQKFPFFANFDGYIYSFEHRAQKPDHRLYEVVEAKAGRQGKQLIYIDDRPENIAAGQARGWQTVLQENPETTRDKVCALTGLAR